MIEVLSFFLAMFTQRHTIFILAKRDYEKQNKGAILGSAWNYLQPLIFICILVFIFSSGFRVGITSTDGPPFTSYLISGMIPWLFFTSNLNNMTGVIKSYSFLIKKVDFNLATLPIIKILSAMPIHFVLIISASIYINLTYELSGLYILQLIYYFFSMFFLLLGLGLLFSSLSPFFKDINNIVQIVTQFGFWLTPIFWNMDTFPEKVQFYLKLNPMVYIINGYRDSLLLKQWFWEKPTETLFFWVFTLISIFIGHIVFKRLQPHFVEVL